MSRTDTAAARQKVTERAGDVVAGGAARGMVGGAVAGVVLAAVTWAYWSTIVGLWKDWRSDPNYSVGQLVPLAACYLLWQDRSVLRRCRIAPCWWGLGFLVLGQFGWLFGLLFLYESAQRYALVLTIGGLVLLVAGREVFWRVRWVLVFLLLMVPLPGRIHNAVSGPLQEHAMSSTLFVLEVCGAEVTRAGNTLTLGESAHVGIAEACSGLRMLTAFTVVAAVFALLVDRPRWQRGVLVVSSVPIAIICNVVRLVVTVVLYAITSSSIAERFFHDFAGVTMMPLAIALLIGELWLMNRLVTRETAEGKAARRNFA